MERAVVVGWLLGLLGAMPLSAQETASPRAAPPGSPHGQLCAVLGTPSASDAQAATSDEVGLAQAFPWQTAWGLAGLRAIPAGPKVAPNGQEYHPNFSIDLDFNCWVWRSQGLYLFADMRLWGEKSEHGVTNGRDGWWGASKRDFDLLG